jgi:3D (Asp-Asp-Asp) domain-containing protein
VSFAPAAISVAVPVTGIAQGSAVITANATVVNFPALATAAVNVTGAIKSPTVTAIYGANYIQLINVALTNTSGVTAVNLRVKSVTKITAVAPSVIALRSNVIIPMPYGNLTGGQTVIRSFSFEATAGSVEVPFTFMITYEADNMPQQTAVIDVPFPRSMSFSGSPLGTNPGASGKLTLNLLGNQAPAGGLIVNLSSSDPGKATVPATVSFAPGATSVTVPVTGVAPGSAVITANATVVNFPATATAIVNVGGGR